MQTKSLNVVFGPADRGHLINFLKNHETKFSDEILNFEDDLTYGEIEETITNELIENRAKYFCEVEKNIYEDTSVEYLVGKFKGHYIDLDDYDKIIVWHSHSIREILGLMYLAKIYKKDIYSVDISIVRGLSVAKDIDIEEAIRKIEKVNHIEKDILLERWERITREPGLLRVYEGNKIVNVLDDYYDKYILEVCKEDFMPAAKVIGIVMTKLDFDASLEFLLYRVVKLVENRLLDAEGDSKNLSGFKIRKLI